MTLIKSHPYLFSTGLLVMFVVISIAVGSVFIPPEVIALLLFNRTLGLDTPVDWQGFATILFSLRLPRTALVMLAGMALSGSGAAYQGLFRNPLADPYLVGVASGAGLGAVIAMSVRWPYSTLGLLAVPLAALAGGLLTVAVVYRLARINQVLPISNLILAGVAASSFTTSLTSFLMIRSTGEIHRSLVWLLGGATMSGWQPVLASLPYIAGGLGVLIAMGHALNILQFGDEQAQQLGLHANRIRRIIILSATLTTAAAISFAGVIGFVGLVVPHVVRMIWGPDYRHLIPLAVIIGASFLLGADVLARILISPSEVPLGIITALTGAPFFLWIMRRARSQTLW